MNKQIVEEALDGNFTNFAELFKEELNIRLHEALEAKKQSVIDSAHNVCESCDPDEDIEDFEEEYGDDLMKEGLDAVGKEDSDVDNDGDSDSSDRYLKKRRKAIGKAMKKEGAPLKKGKINSSRGGGY